MLFGIRPGLDQSRVFDGLNRFLREVLLATLERRAVDQTLLPKGLHAAVSANPPTRKAVNKLLTALAALEQQQKDVLREALLLNLEPCDFLGSRDLELPPVPASIFPHLKALSSHLYERTVKLSGVETACGECVDDHYARFRATFAPGNGNVCCVCGTQSLAQIQAGVDDIEQWRGPYDHLLAKHDYPLYGVHPNNLVPICETCNSRAKQVKDLLLKNGSRRLSFSPWTECASANEIHVSIDTSGLFPCLGVSFSSGDADRQEKLNTWDDVYRIKDRVEGEFSSLPVKLAEDLSALDDAAFLKSLEQRAVAKANTSRFTPFNYWRARAYTAVKAMDYGSREALRLAIANAIPRDEEMEGLFFS